MAETRTGQRAQAEIQDLAQRLGAALGARRLVLAVAESCTGGGIAEAVTSVPGSSGWFDAALVAYSDRAKRELLGVPPQVLDAHGAVSEAAVRAMAAGALARTGAGVAVAVSGVAGPGGGTAAKPVGTVWTAWRVAGGAERTVCRRYPGDRRAVRRAAVAAGLRGLLELLGERQPP